MHIYFFLFILGVIIGSFLNVVSLRYSPEEGFNIKNLFGRSHCLSCKKTLAWHELIPIMSFFLQKRRCRSCKARLSWQYPLVELASGFIFLTPFFFYSRLAPDYSIFSGVILILLFLVFLLIGIIDYRHYIISDRLVILLAILGIGSIILKIFYGQFGYLSGSYLGNYALLFGLRDSILINHAFGAFIAAFIFGFIILATRGGGMGMGDLKLIAALGIFFGWPDIIFAIIFSFLIGSIVSLLLLAFGNKTMKSRVPFGPFIILGSAVLIFFGKGILGIYFKLFNLL